MATEYVKFTGKAKWAKVYEPDEFRGSTNWSINLYLDDDQLQKRRDKGIQSKEYEDEEGKYVTFKRPQTKTINNEINLFPGPKVLSKDGKTLVEYKKNDEGTAFLRVGDPVLIGNGSVVTVTVAVYDSKMGKGQRLESVQIDDLITFVPEGNGNSSITLAATKPAGGVKAPW